MNRVDFYKRYWLLVEEVLNRMKIEKPRSKAKKELHVALKEFFDIDTLTRVKEEAWPSILMEIRVLMTDMYGWILREPGERFDPDKISLKKLLKIKLNEGKSTKKIINLPPGR